MFNTFTFNSLNFNGSLPVDSERGNDEHGSIHAVLGEVNNISVISQSVEGATTQLSSRETHSILTERNK